MTIFVIYLLIILWLIKHNAFFGLLDDDKLNKTQLVWMFFFKALAVPLFYYVYKKLYGGIESLDAGKFYGDAQVIGSYALQDPIAFIRLMLGLQDDAPGSADYINYLSRTLNWDNGTMKDYLYNDNRVVIRVHALFYFIGFGSYFAQALFNCFLGFLGIFRLYKSLKPYMVGKEFWLMAILCFFPSLWFYTGAVLKEGLVLFVLGHLLWLTLRIMNGERKLVVVLATLFLLYLGFLLKPYIVLFCWFCFGLFFVLDKKQALRYKTLLFFSVLAIVFALLNLFSWSIKGRTVVAAVMKHQRTFAGVTKGGIYLYDKDKYIRLDYDTTLINKKADSVFAIKRGSSFMYWTNNNALDTLFCKANTDTTSVYRLDQMVMPGRSNIETGTNEGYAKTILHSVYHSLFYPLFFNAHGAMQWLGSAENLLLLFSLVFIVVGIIRQKKADTFVLVLVCITLCVCVLAGVATPNSGAIFRYRSPVAIYLLIAALYYFPLKRRSPAAE